MILNKKHLSWEVRSGLLTGHMIDSQISWASERFNKTDDETKDYIRKTFHEIMDCDVTTYIIKPTAFNIIDRINLSGSFDYKVFTKIKINKGEIILDENTLYRYHYDGKELRCVYIERSKYRFHYDSFSIHPENGNKSYNIYESERVENIAQRFFKILIFLYFSEIQEVILKPKQKIGVQSSGKYINDLNHDFIIVDTTWNRISIRNVGFTVSGHFRLQPCGPNNQSRKLIFIDEFKKEGYVRGAKKELLKQ